MTIHEGATLARSIERAPKRRRWWRPKPASDPEALFLEHRPLIEKVAAHAGRRAGLPPQDVEDFVSTVQVKLIDDDYAVLRRHRGESSLPTYLTTVVHNLFKDFCNQKFGKFRPSAKARELGPAALALERLLVRDRHDLETAIRLLGNRPDLQMTDGAWRELAAQLPVRGRPRLVGEEALAGRASEAPEDDARRRVEAGEQIRTAAQVAAVLRVALKTLDAEDLLILKMHYRDGWTVARIASALSLNQRSLYTRRDRTLRILRDAFESRGVTWEEVREILGWQGEEIRTDFGKSDTGAVQ